MNRPQRSQIVSTLAGALLIYNLPFSPVLYASDSENDACRRMVDEGFRPFSNDRSQRFLGKVEAYTARCRGGDKALQYRSAPWVDWQNYYATGDESSRHQGKESITKLGEHLKPNGRGIDGALMDLEYQRIELIKFNLFDPNTYDDYLLGRDGKSGPTLKLWEEMRLSADSPYYQQVGGAGKQQCRGDLITHRTLSGICNDINNPLMGSSGMPFSRNMIFEETFPRLGLNELTRNRHNGRIDLLTPDPQLISRKLFSREQSPGNGCNLGLGLPGNDPQADCDYIKAPFFNVLAAFWIQFMTHDWFSHTVEGRNESKLEPVGCDSAEAEQLGCRPADLREVSLYEARDPNHAVTTPDGKTHLLQAPKTTLNQNTAWWDLSQIYGFDQISQQRVQRDPQDPAKLLLPGNYLPLLPECANYSSDCPVQPQWAGQEAAAFPDNWSIGLSFYHNLFSREHNAFVEQFRSQQQRTPDADSGLRDPAQPAQVITYQQVSDERLFQVARLVSSAEVAKIHTIEWTPQLLYDEPLYLGMNANWFGLLSQEEGRISKILRRITGQEESLLSRWTAKLTQMIGLSDDPRDANSIYSLLASGAGIFGLGNRRQEGFLWWKHDAWSIANPEDINGGVNHFGSPFNFPEEFTSVYRLHPLVPDLIEYREVSSPNTIKLKIPAVETVRGKATGQMHRHGLNNWALSMGRQRLGALLLRNQPQFLQNLAMPHLDSQTHKLDITALDLIRDRERGIPRFNEFRRQIGLKTLTSFDDFIDPHLTPDDPMRRYQQETIKRLREVYGTHICDTSKIISVTQRNDDGGFIDDCLGHPDGSVIDNIEDVDNVVGWLAEYTRPHGFAISETQFQIFILNASRRLFSDRFFTSSFRPEFYSRLGYDWVNKNGPLSDCPYAPVKLEDGQRACMEPVQVNGHAVPVSPLKRMLIRNIPALKDELRNVYNAFDPWARDRGDYYDLSWQPRFDAKDDPSFH